MKLRTLALAGAAALLTASAAFAQTAPGTYPAPKKPGLFSRMFHHPKTGTMPMHPGMTPMRHGPAMMPGTSYPGSAYPGTTMPGHHRMLGHRPMMGGSTFMSGGIVGNKNTHVYHMSGDKGNMPAANNRVYFHTEAEAQAAGYRAAGSAHGSSSMAPGRHHGNSSMAPGHTKHHMMMQPPMPPMH